MKQKICASIIPRNLAQVRAQAQTARRLRADLLEVRLDMFHDAIPVKVAKKFFRGPVIATDHGNSHSSRHDKLSVAAELGADIVDLELNDALSSSNIQLVRGNGARLLVSWHDRRQTPNASELMRILQRQHRLRADICKVVTTARKPEDNVTILRFLQQARNDGPIVSFAMGMHGRPSRVLGPLLGSEFAYASLTPRTATAPGQFTVTELKQAWKIFGLE